MNKVAKHIPHTWMKWMRPVLKPNHLPFCILSLSTYFHKCCFCLVIYKFLLVNVNTILLPSCTSSKLPFHGHCWTRNLDVHPCVTSRVSWGAKTFQFIPLQSHTWKLRSEPKCVVRILLTKVNELKDLFGVDPLYLGFSLLRKGTGVLNLKGSQTASREWVLTLWCTVKQTPRTPWNLLAWALLTPKLLFLRLTNC